MSSKKPSGRITSLEGIRAIAFLAILLSHTAAIVPGRWGVSVFFILSGFVMTYAYYDRDVSTRVEDALAFSVVRIKKLYVLHIIMLLVGVFYAFTFFEPSIKEALWSLPISVVLFQTWTPFSYVAWNAVAWYLSVTLFLYFVFPYILRLLKRSGTTALKLLTIALLAFIAQLLVGYLVSLVDGVDSRWFFYCFPPYRVPDFIIGCCGGAFFLKRQGKLEMNFFIMSFLEVLVVAITCASIVYFMKNASIIGGEWWSWSSLFLPIDTALVVVFAFNRGFLSKLISNPVFMFVAKISQYAFLIHLLVTHFVREYIDRCTNLSNKKYYSMLVTVLVLVITVLCSLAYKGVSDYVKSRNTRENKNA